jgi:hypothetical protein
MVYWMAGIMTLALLQKDLYWLSGGTVFNDEEQTCIAARTAQVRLQLIHHRFHKYHKHPYFIETALQLRSNDPHLRICG